MQDYKVEENITEGLIESSTSVKDIEQSKF